MVEQTLHIQDMLSRFENAETSLLLSSTLDPVLAGECRIRDSCQITHPAQFGHSIRQPGKVCREGS